MEATILQRLLHRIAVKRVIEAFESVLTQSGISSRRLSEEAGMPSNAFSGTKSEIEDPRLSTFLRYVAALQRILSKDEDRFVHFDSLVGAGLRIIDLADQLSLAGPEGLSPSQMELFNSLRGDVATMEKRGALSVEERAEFHRVYKHFQQRLRQGGWRE